MRNGSVNLAGVVFASVAVGVMSAADRPQERITSTTVERVDLPDFPAAPGWDWLVRPQEFRPSDFRSGKSFGQSGQDRLVTGYAHVDAEGGGLRILVVQAGPAVPHHEFPETRLVVLDAAGKRYLPGHPDARIQSTMGNKQTQAGHSIYALGRGVLPPDKVAHIGIERVARAAP